MTDALEFECGVVCLTLPGNDEVQRDPARGAELPSRRGEYTADLCTSRLQICISTGRSLVTPPPSLDVCSWTTDGASVPLRRAGRGAHRNRRRAQEGLLQAGAAVASRQEPRQPRGGRGALQGAAGCARGAHRPARAQLVRPAPRRHPARRLWRGGRCRRRGVCRPGEPPVVLLHSGSVLWVPCPPRPPMLTRDQCYY